MRIAVFTESFHPVINGVASAVGWLAEAMRPEHEVTIFAPRFPGYREAERDVVRLDSYRLPTQPEYPLAFPWSVEGGRRFAQGRFDIVHTHSPFSLGQMGLRWARQAGIPVVTTYHTLYVEYAHYAAIVPTAPVRVGLRSLSRNYCNAADQVAVPTTPIRDVLHTYGVKTPVHVIPTGLPPMAAAVRDDDYPRRALGIGSDARIVLYAGRLAKEKNLELLFRAFSRVAACCPAAHLLLAGSGPSEPEARRLTESLKLKERVTFAGFIGRDQLQRCYSDAALLAFTSLTDTQGLVIVEAKSAGLPVVSVDAYGPSTIVRHGVDGYLVPNDAEAFAAAALRILEDPAAQQRMSAAAKQDAQRFRIEVTAAEYLALYERAIRERRGAPAPALQGGRVQG